MNTQNARVTIKEAAALTGVSERTVRRWTRAGFLTDIVYGPVGSTVPATYDPAEVMEAREKWRQLILSRVGSMEVEASAEEPETDISG